MFLNKAKTQVYIWPYGISNAATYIHHILQFESNLELLIECEDFLDELDLNRFIFSVDNLPTVDDKIDRFYDLELSNWTMKESFASAFFYLIKMEKKRSKNHLKFSTAIYIQKYMDIVCNDMYSDIIIEIYLFFNVFNLYPDQCINGCVNFFSKTCWNINTKNYLNHLGLKKLLNLVNIEPKSLEEIINLCNYMHTVSPFILYLVKYNIKGEFFFNKNYYDKLFTLVQSCNYIQLENFYGNKEHVEVLYFELCKIEKRRIINLVYTRVKVFSQIKIAGPIKKNIFKKKMFFTWVRKGMFLSTLVVLSTTMLISLKRNNYSQSNSFPPYATFATLSNPALSRLSSKSSISESSTVNSASEHRSISTLAVTEGIFSQSSTISTRGRPKIIIPKHSGFRSSTIKTEREFLTDQLFPKRNKSVSDRLKLKLCLNPTTQENPNTTTERISTGSTDIPSSTNSIVFKTSKRIFSGRVYKEKLWKKGKLKQSPVDLLFIKGSKHKVSIPIPYVNKHIIRKKFTQTAIKKYNLKGKYAYFIPDSNNHYKRLTIVGNVFSCAESKSFKKELQKIVNDDASYKLLPHTFEHVLPEKWLKTMNISRLPRSGVGDPAVGPLIGEIGNKLMGKNKIKLTAPYSSDNKDLTIFDPNSQFNIVDLLTIWTKEHQHAGLARFEKNCETDLEEAQKKCFSELAKSSSWEKLSEDKKYEKSYAYLKKYLNEQLDKDNSLLVDSALRDVYQKGYKESTKYSLADVESWQRKTQLEKNQTPGYFFARTLVNSAESQLYTDFLLINYNKYQPTKEFVTLPCPLEFCRYHFKQQISRTEALHKLSFYMQESWPDEGNNKQLYKLLAEEKSRMKIFNEEFLNQAVEILRQVKEEAQINPNGVQFFDKKNTLQQVNFTEYEQEFEEEIKSFKDEINSNFIPVTEDSNKITFDLLFNLDNDFDIDVETGKASNWRANRFIKPFECNFREPFEKYKFDIDTISNIQSEPNPETYL